MGPSGEYALAEDLELQLLECRVHALINQVRINASSTAANQSTTSSSGAGGAGAGAAGSGPNGDHSSQAASGTPGGGSVTSASSASVAQMGSANLAASGQTNSGAVNTMNGVNSSNLMNVNLGVEGGKLRLKAQDKKILAWLEEEVKERLDDEALAVAPSSWKLRERMKTSMVGLALCLNIGTDPPDVVKTDPCARLECWIDPGEYYPTSRALEKVATALQSQFELWHPRARYRYLQDPSGDRMKHLCSSLRKAAKSERVLFHFNGHGVPRPTANGEIWVFSDDFTQYIPLSVYELRSWLGTPVIYTFDCSSAGLLLPHFLRDLSSPQQVNPGDPIVDGQGNRNARNAGIRREPTPNDIIVLLSCGPNEILPSSPDFPADIFTSCLTTPIKIALRWYVMQHRVSMDALGITVDMVDFVPGRLNDRKTPLGELNWIFTAITDTIAWTVIPRSLFRKLFRQDILVASLFRNFLLAERVLKSLNCTPQSYPVLPSTWQHHLWQSWDMAVENCLTQLPYLMPHLFTEGSVSVGDRRAGSPSNSTWNSARPMSMPGPGLQHQHRSSRPAETGMGENRAYTYRQSEFFAHQLTAFEVWLTYGENVERREVPEQLPIVLQVLLSSFHRQRALDLLARFLNLGSWAVSLALSVGIFPYVNKLLLSAQENRPVLIHIWSKILALDSSCQADLVKEISTPHAAAGAAQAGARGGARPPGERGHQYFVNQIQWLQLPKSYEALSSADLTEVAQMIGHSRRAAFVLSVILDGHPVGQQLCLQDPLLEAIRKLLLAPLATDEEVRCALLNLKIWLCFVLSKLCERHAAARRRVIALGLRETLFQMIDQTSDVGLLQAAFLALGGLMGPRYPRGVGPTGTQEPAPVTPVGPNPGTGPQSVGQRRQQPSHVQSAYRGRGRAGHSYVNQQAQMQQGARRGGVQAGQVQHPQHPQQGQQHHSTQYQQQGPTAHQQQQQEQQQQAQQQMLADQRHRFEESEPEAKRQDCVIASHLLNLLPHGSPTVRREIVLSLARFMVDPRHATLIQLTVHELKDLQGRTMQSRSSGNLDEGALENLVESLKQKIGPNTETYLNVWLTIKQLAAHDPFPAVSRVANLLVEFVRIELQKRIEAIRSHAGLQHSDGRDPRMREYTSSGGPRGGGTNTMSSTISVGSSHTNASGGMNGHEQNLQMTSDDVTRRHQQAGGMPAPLVGGVGPQQRQNIYILAEDILEALGLVSTLYARRAREFTKPTPSASDDAWIPKEGPHHEVDPLSADGSAIVRWKRRKSEAAQAAIMLMYRGAQWAGIPQADPKILEDVISAMAGPLGGSFSRSTSAQSGISQGVLSSNSGSASPSGASSSGNGAGSGMMGSTFGYQNNPGNQSYLLASPHSPISSSLNIDYENSAQARVPMPALRIQRRLDKLSHSINKHGAGLLVHRDETWTATQRAWLGDLSKPGKFEEHAIFDHGQARCSQLLFHPFEPVVVVAGQTGDISLWSYPMDGTASAQASSTENRLLNRFDNETCVGVRSETDGFMKPNTMVPGDVNNSMQTPWLNGRDPSAPNGTPGIAAMPNAKRNIQEAAGQRQYSTPPLGPQQQTLQSRLQSQLQIQSQLKPLTLYDSGTPHTPPTRNYSSTNLAARPTKPSRGPVEARITAMTWMNETAEPFLMVGSDDGRVRVWRNVLERCDYGKLNGARLVTAWTALPELRAGASGPGMVLNMQRSGHLLCGGALQTVAIWDLTKECEVGRVDTGIQEGTTSIAAYGPSLGLGGTGVPNEIDMGFHGTQAGGEDGAIFVVGGGDGSLRIFDKRVRAGGRLATTVATCTSHRSWIVSVSVPSSGEGRTIVSGSVSGEVRFWDIRRFVGGSFKYQNQLNMYYAARSKGDEMPRPTPASVLPALSFTAHRTPMTALAHHEFAPIFASGSHHQFIHVANAQGENLSSIRYHDGFLRQRIGPVSCLSFHPYKLLLGAGALDSIVSVYRPATSLNVSTSAEN